MVVMLLVFSVFFVPVQGFLCAAGGLAEDLRSAGQEFCGMEVLAGDVNWSFFPKGRHLNIDFQIQHLFQKNLRVVF